MRKMLVLCCFLLCLVAIVGCQSDDSEKSGQPNTPSGANMAVAPTPTSSINLLAIAGACKLQKFEQGDSAAGTVKLELPKKGEFEACGVLPPNKQGFVAFQARGLPGSPGWPTLRVIAPMQLGTSDCEVAKPTGVNYSPDTKIPVDKQVIYVTKGIGGSTCKVETISYDEHHWKGKLTANLLPSNPAAGNKTVPAKAEWDLYF